MNKETRELLVSLISINSSYASQVKLSRTCGLSVHCQTSFKFAGYIGVDYCPLLFLQVVPGKNLGEQATQLGNKTECGLLGFVLSMGQSYQAIRDKYPEEKLFKVFQAKSVTSVNAYCA